jgi:hypothetical protein
MKLALMSLSAMLANCGPADTPSRLVAGLERLTVDDARRELDRRLARRFAPGTTEAALVSELEAEGFQVGQRAPFCEQPKCASTERRPDRIGGLAWSVRWTTDRAGQIATVTTGTVALLN